MIEYFFKSYLNELHCVIKVFRIFSNVNERRLFVNKFSYIENERLTKNNIIVAKL